MVSAIIEIVHLSFAPCSIICFLPGRGMWDTDEETLDKLRNLYSDADDLIEQVASSFG
jgi:hypothetical protein